MPPDSQVSPLQQPVATLWGVGPDRAAMLARLDIRTVVDLLLHKPRRYEDRRKFLAIRDLQLKEPATVRGKVVVAGIKRWKRGARALFECVLDDGTALLHLRWWQAYPWMEDYYTVGREFLAFGKTDSLRPRTFEHAETEPIEPGEDEYVHVNRIVPIHPLTEGLTARVMRTLVWRALERHESHIPEPAYGTRLPARDSAEFPALSASPQPKGLPEISRGLSESASDTPGKSENKPPTLKGSQTAL